jgi:hypothetical protein
MKTVLLTIIAFTAAAAFGQRKLAAERSTYFDESGTVMNIDSSSYSYEWNRGFLDQHRPEFGILHDAPIYLWEYETPAIDFTTREFWGGMSFPLNLYTTATKTYNENNQCLSEVQDGYRELFTYTASGKIATHSFEYEDSPGVWEVSELTTYSYDASDRLIAVRQYDGWEGFDTQIDSTWYDGTTENVTTKKYFESLDGITFYEMGKSVTYWNAGRPDYVNYYEDNDDDPLTPIEWIAQANYNYTGNNCTSITAYFVIMGVPQTTVIAEWNYTFNAANIPTQISQSGGFGAHRTTFTYDIDNFLTSTVDEEDEGSGMYIYRNRVFYYMSAVGLNENSSIELTLYPNPAVDQLNLPSTFAQVTVYDLSGSVLIRQKGTSTVDVSHLKAGNYFIHATNEQGTATATFVKQ